MIFSRKLILVAGAALLAACGDKVTVAPPTPPVTPVTKINSVNVAPLTATITAGASIAFTAAVNADAGVTYTTAWSSSVSSVTVSSAGVVTTTAASVTPGAAICATATAGTQVVKGCGTLVVTPVSQVLPATVSILSVTQGGLNLPLVGPAKGQIDVTLNVNPGNQVITKVETLVGGVVACTQTFTAAQAAALRFASDEAVAAQTTFPQIVCSVNTAAYAPLTGIPTWLNGTQAVQAKVYTTTSGTATAATASAVQTLTFANADGYVATVATSGTTANALSSTGFRYDRGGLDVKVLPVIYSGGAINATSGVTLFFGSACDASGTGQRSTAMTAPTTGTSWTKTGWAQTKPSGSSYYAVNYLENYEFSAAACPGFNPTGESIAVTATDANGDALFSVAAPINAAALNSLRLDNRGPNALSPTFVANPNFRQNGWINGAVSLVGIRTATSTTSNSWLLNAAQTDEGQGSYIPFLRIAASATGTVNEARAATASSAPTLPAPSAQGSTYCAIATAQDALGNETARPAADAVCGVVQVGSTVSTGASSQLFGVDIAPPTIALLNSTDTPAGSLDANTGYNTATNLGAAGNFQVTVLDTGAVGNSGMYSGSAVVGTVIVRNDAASPALTNGALGTAGSYCAVGKYATDGTTCGSTSLGFVYGLPVVGTGTGVTSNVTPGYYTYTAVARDAAGNSSGTVSRTVAFNLTANVPALTTAIFSTPLTGSTVTFNANASTNFDLKSARYTMTYSDAGAVLPGPVRYPDVTLGTFFPTAQSYSNVAAGITLTNFYRSVEGVVTTHAANVILGVTTPAGSVPFKPLTLTGKVYDQAGVVSANVPTTIPAASVTNGVTKTAAIPSLLIRAWDVSNGAVSVSDGETVPSPTALATSVVLTADLYGPTATFQTPFVRVDFYRFDGTNLRLIGGTTSYTQVDDGSTFGRKITYSVTWTPGAITNQVWPIYAIGVDVNGDALVTLVNNNITVAP